jgi:hypothetical protein
MRSIHIYCDGGFGNRYNALLSGLAIAESAGLAPIVVWPTNNWCGASYAQIFSEPRAVLDRELLSYVEHKADFQHLMVQDHLGMGVPNASPAGFTELPALLAHIAADSRDVFYYVALIPPCVDLSLIQRQVLAHPFRSEIRQRAQDFIRTQGLTEYFGVQIRKTDFGALGADDQNLHDLIERCPHKRFFVCSDDAEVEQRFARLPNVCIYQKQAHVEKLVSGAWTETTADCSGRVYACNVNRGALSVTEAIVDLLVLARSQIVRTSGSTFLNAALLLQACGAD